MDGLAQVDAVVIHVPGFVRNSPNGPSDDAIQTWIDTRWEEIFGVLTRRALAVPAADTDAWTQLELINRIGAAADLAAAIAVNFSAGTRWQVEKNLRDDYLRMLGRLDGGEMDKLLNPAAKTADTGPALLGDPGRNDDRHGFFRRGMRF